MGVKEGCVEEVAFEYLKTVVLKLVCVRKTQGNCSKCSFLGLGVGWGGASLVAQW